MEAEGANAEAQQGDSAMSAGREDPEREAHEAKRQKVRDALRLMALPTMHHRDEHILDMVAAVDQASIGPKEIAQMLPRRECGSGQPPAASGSENETVINAMPDEEFELQVMDWTKDYFGAKSGKLLDKQRVFDARMLELENMKKLEVYEPIKISQAKADKMEIVYTKWLDDEKPTAEDPLAVRSRLVATQINDHFREDVTQATPPIKVARTVLSVAASMRDH